MRGFKGSHVKMPVVCDSASAPTTVDYERNLSVLRWLRQNTRHFRLKPEVIPNPSLLIVEPLKERKNNTEGQTSILLACQWEQHRRPHRSTLVWRRAHTPTILKHFQFQVTSMRQPVLATGHFSASRRRNRAMTLQ